MLIAELGNRKCDPVSEMRFSLNSVRDDRLRAWDDDGVPDGWDDDVRTAEIGAGSVGKGEAEHDPHHAHPRRGLPRVLDSLLRHLSLVSHLRTTKNNFPPVSSIFIRE